MKEAFAAIVKLSILTYQDWMIYPCSTASNGILEKVHGRFLQKETKGTKGKRMHPLFAKADTLSHEAIGTAIEVHRAMGAVLIESIYEKCMMRELTLRNLGFVTRKLVRIEHKGFSFEEPLRFDVLVEGCLLLELKCVQEILPVHKAQLLSYMKLLNVPIGLIINFHELKVTDGVVRMILPGANQ